MRLPLLVLAGALCLATTPFGHAQHKKIGETFLYGASSPHPYAQAQDDETPVWQHTIRHPGARYLRVYVTMDLAPGDFLVVLDKYGKERWRYGAQGPLKGGEFLTDTVFGDEVKLVLYGPFGGSYGLDIRAYDWGWPRSWFEYNPLDTHCNSPTGQVGFDCVTDPILQGIGDACVGLVSTGGIFCSASICSTSGHVITADHCVGSASSAANTNLWVRYEEDCATGTVPGNLPIVVPGPMAFLVNDSAIDFSIMLPPTNPALTVGNVTLEARDPVAGEPLYIIGHPSGRPKEYDEGPATGEYSGCSIGTIGTTTTHMRYRFDTEGGNSGSGVFSAFTNCQIAVHTCGGCTVGDPTSSNSGGRMTQILPVALPVVPGLAICGQTITPIRGRDARVELDGPAPTFDRNFINVGPDGDVVIDGNPSLLGNVTVTSPDLNFAPQVLAPGGQLTVTVPNNQKPGHYEIQVIQAAPPAQASLFVSVGQEPVGIEPSWGAVHRVYPQDHRAEGAASEFTTTGTVGSLTDLGFDDDFAFQSSNWNSLMTNPGGGSLGTPLADEFDFVIDPAGSTVGSQIQTIDFFAEAYFTGLQGTGGTPPGSDDSSEEDLWYDAKVQIYDFGSGTWMDVGDTFIDGTQYTWGTTWRNATYAERWCRPGHPNGYAGPIQELDNAPGYPNSVVDNTSGSSVVRLRVANWMVISSGAWDSTRYYDEVRLAVNTGGGAQNFNPTAFRATDGTGGVFTAVGEGGSAVDMASNDNVYAYVFYRDATTMSPVGTGAPIQLQYGSEFDFDLTPIGIDSGDDIDQLRIFAELYMRGSGQKTDEDVLHACRFEVYNWGSGTWNPLPTFLDSSQYTLGTPWTGAYADSWGDQVGGTNPGPVDQVVTGLVAGNVQAGTNLLRLRLFKDATFNDSLSGANVSHIFDQVYVEVRPAGVEPRGRGCVGSAATTAIARTLSAVRVSENLVISQYLGTPGAPSIPIIGFSDTSFAGVPLPLDLGPFGSPDCIVFSSHNFVLGNQAAGPNGEASLVIPASNDPLAVGFTMYLQWYQFDTVNTLGIIVSDMIAMTIGL